MASDAKGAFRHREPADDCPLSDVKQVWTEERGVTLACTDCDPTRYGCTDAEHGSTRVICECPWFDGACHACAYPGLTDVPTCMTFWEEPDVE